MKQYTALLWILAFVLFSSFTTDKHWKRIESKSLIATDTLGVVTVGDKQFESAVIEQDSLQIVEEINENLELITPETKASYYHDKFIGKKTASGALFDNKAYTAAHKTLPFGTKVKVTNLYNLKSVILTITDRGPFTKGRDIDITKKAYMELAENKGAGVLDVKIERINESI